MGLFWKMWDGRVGAGIRWAVALIGFFILGNEPYNFARVMFATLIGVFIGWRARRRMETRKARHPRTTKLARIAKDIRHFLVGNGDR